MRENMFSDVPPPPTPGLKKLSEDARVKIAGEGTPIHPDDPPPVVPAVPREHGTVPLIPLTTDERLIHAIYQAGPSPIGFFRARNRGVRVEHLFPEAAPIYALMEQLAPKGRLPSLGEVQLKTGIRIDRIVAEPYDVDLVAEEIVKRALGTQLKTRLGTLSISDKLITNPVEIRNELYKLWSECAWSYGEPYSINSRAAIAELQERYNRREEKGDNIAGLGSPWPTMDRASDGLQPGELTVIFAKRKIGKTVSSLTLLHDPYTGRERTIQDVVSAGSGSVLTWQKNKPITAAQPSAYMECGEKECFQITYKSGRKIIAAPTHPFLTTRGWKRLDELQVGQHTAAVAIFPEPLKPEAMPAHEVKILAYMLADGGCTSGTPDYTQRDATLVSDLRSAVVIAGCQLNQSSVPDRYLVVRIGDTNHVTELLRRHDVWGKKSVHKTIPDAIFSLPNDQLALFIGRLFSGDGCVSKNGKSYLVSYSTGSRKMAEQIQHLLLRFGVQSKIYTKPREVADQETGEKVQREYWELLIRTETIERFKQTVGQHVIGPKKALLDQIVFEGESRVGWLKNEELWDEILSEIEAQPELIKALGDRLGYTTFRFQKSHILDYKSGRIRRKLFEAFCAVYESPLKWVLDENIWWDEIESIEPAGKHRCYDLSVPPTECYVANDFIVHNSWAAIAWAMHIWRNDIKPGEKLLFVTMEMTRLQVLQRMAAVDLKISYNDFRNAKLSTEDKARFDAWCKARVESMKGDPDLILADSNQVRTVQDLSALVGEYRPKGVIVDSFYILGRASGKSLHERVLTNVQELKLDIALQHNVPVLASTQLKGTTSKDVLDADSDDAMGAKAIGDYADATRLLAANKKYLDANQRVWRSMEAREFIGKDLVINFNLDTMDFSEDGEYDEARQEADRKEAEEEEAEEEDEKPWKRKRGRRRDDDDKDSGPVPTDDGDDLTL